MLSASSRRLGLCLSASALSIGMACAMAGSTAAQTTPAAKDGEPVEVVVTAFKRSSTALKTPAALTVLSGNALKDAGVNSVSDIQNVVPNVNIASGRDGIQIAIRGITTYDTSSKGEQDIAFNLDGAYIGRGYARGGAFFDVDHVEVLRGPQGTLYGRSSTGGAVNVISVHPKLGDTSGYANVEFGNYNSKKAEAGVNLPLGDKAAVRISGMFADRDGYSKPIDYTTSYNGTDYTFSAGQAPARNDQKDGAGRVSFLFKPTDDTTVNLSATVGHQGGAGSAPALETQLQANNDKGTKALNILTNPVPAFLDNNFAIYNASLNHKFGNIQLDVLGSYQDVRFKQQSTSVQDTAANGGGVISPIFLMPPAATFGPTFQFYLQKNSVKTNQWEVRFSNVDPSKIDYVVGANYFDEASYENGQSWNALIDDPLNQASYTFQNGPINNTAHKAWGVFGQTTWNVTSQLGVVTGIRYTHDEVSRTGRFALPFNFAAGFPPPPYPDANGNAICHYPDDCVGDPNNGGAEDNKITWKLGLNYQATPRDLFYASISTGFKGGGFNDYDPVTGGIANYEPESVTAYEVGYKGRPLANLTYSTSLFYYDFSSMQINSGAVFPDGKQGLFTQSVPVEISGWENELSYRFAQQTSLDGSLSFLHSEFKNFQAGSLAFSGNGIDFSGKPVDQAPEFTVTLAFNHGIALSADTSMKFRLGMKYSDSYYVSDFGDGVRYLQPSYTRTDASVTYEFGDGKYSLQAFVENLEDKVQRTTLLGYANSGLPYGGDNAMVPTTGVPANNIAFYTTTPRFFGLRLNTKF